MSLNNRFSVSVHIMTALAYNQGERATSNDLAQSICTNAVVVRRLLSQLNQAGLVVCRSGKSGGCDLARSPDKITLDDIYKAVESGGPFAIPHKPENKACRVSCHMQEILADIFKQTEHAISDRLKRITLTDLVKTVKQASAA